ncbi:hypothetical protein DOY81_007731 [Sarcophaga bullata]|nr:hypothetical protein DOY81_007731 [Sarcophaga bullata]
MFKITFAILAAFLLVGPAFGKIYNRCSLAREMHRLGVPKDELARWTCIAEHESGYNTKAVGSMNYNGSRTMASSRSITTTGALHHLVPSPMTNATSNVMISWLTALNPLLSAPVWF